MELLIGEPKESDFPANVETLGIFLSNYNKKISLLASNLDGAVKKHWPLSIKFESNVFLAGSEVRGEVEWIEREALRCNGSFDIVVQGISWRAFNLNGYTEFSVNSVFKDSFRIPVRMKTPKNNRSMKRGVTKVSGVSKTLLEVAHTCSSFDKFLPAHLKSSNDSPKSPVIISDMPIKFHAGQPVWILHKCGKYLICEFLSGEVTILEERLVMDFNMHDENHVKALGEHKEHFQYALGPGHHKFPFSFTLPSNIPPSFYAWGKRRREAGITYILRVSCGSISDGAVFHVWNNASCYLPSSLLDSPSPTFHEMKQLAEQSVVFEGRLTKAIYAMDEPVELVLNLPHKSLVRKLITELKIRIFNRLQTHLPGGSTGEQRRVTKKVIVFTRSPAPSPTNPSPSGIHHHTHSNSGSDILSINNVINQKINVDKLDDTFHITIPLPYIQGEWMPNISTSNLQNDYSLHIEATLSGCSFMVILPLIFVPSTNIDILLYKAVPRKNSTESPSQTYEMSTIYPPDTPAIQIHNSDNILNENNTPSQQPQETPKHETLHRRKSSFLELFKKKDGTSPVEHKQVDIYIEGTSQAIGYIKVKPGDTLKKARKKMSKEIEDLRGVTYIFLSGAVKVSKQQEEKEDIITLANNHDGKLFIRLLGKE